jgi:hypothetical protein
MHYLNRSILLTAITIAAMFATSASAFTMYDTGETGGNPESSLLGVTMTDADVGDDFDIDWSVANVGGTDDLSATGNFTLVSFSETEFVLAVTISNTTVLSSTLTNADILSIGFGVTPDATAAFVSGETGTVFDGIGEGSGTGQNYPGGFKGIDVCVFGQGCAGGAVAEGLHAGDSDTFQLTITGDFSDLTADLLYFGAKFQTNLGSFEPGGSGPSPGVPEPSAALVFGIGIAFASTRVRRTARLA